MITIPKNTLFTSFSNIMVNVIENQNPETRNQQCKPNAVQNKFKKLFHKIYSLLFRLNCHDFEIGFPAVVCVPVNDSLFFFPILFRNYFFRFFLPLLRLTAIPLMIIISPRTYPKGELKATERVKRNTALTAKTVIPIFRTSF